MKLWLVETDYGYDGVVLHGVYTAKEVAIAAADQLNEFWNAREIYSTKAEVREITANITIGEP